MTRDDVIRMALEAGWGGDAAEAWADGYEVGAAAERRRTWLPADWTEYERGIAAAEREACAQVCETLYANLLEDRDFQKHWPDQLRRNKIFAEAIRARVQA